MDTPIQDAVNIRPSWGIMPSGMDSSGGNPMASNDALLAELEGDVPSLANQAATELDNLIIGRGEQTATIQQFAAFLRSELKSPGTATRRMPIRATTLVVMNRAISDSNIGGEAKKVDDVVEQVGQFAESLENVVANPLQFMAQYPGEIERLRAFCLAYSKSVSASERTRNERPRNPFRR